LDCAQAGGELAAGVLASCDRVRDEQLPPLGVRLEDMADGDVRWKLDNPAILMREVRRSTSGARSG
jgi:hypothetical protein